MKSVTLAVDLGGTRMRAAIVESGGGIGARTVMPTPRDQPCAHALYQLMGELSARASGDVGSVVVGVPGRVDYTAGRLEHAPNLPPGWLDDLNEESLGASIGCPVALANDGDMAAVGEALFGAGRDFVDVVYVTFSTGVGAGVVLGGCLVRGRRSLAEIGHTVLLTRDDGQVSTVEDLASGTALGRAAHEAGIAVDGGELVALVGAGMPKAVEVFGRVADAIALTVVNLAQLFSPDVVIIGGGLGRNLDLLGPVIRAALDRSGPRGLPNPIEIAQAALGDDSGLVGAAGWFNAMGPAR